MVENEFEYDNKPFLYYNIEQAIASYNNGQSESFHKYIETIKSMMTEDSPINKFFRDIEIKAKKNEENAFKRIKNADRTKNWEDVIKCVNDASNENMADYNAFVGDVVEYLTTLIM